MRVNLKFLSCLFIAISMIGCSSQEQKKTEEAKEPSAAAFVPKTFERPVAPLIMSDPSERAAYLLEHFWDKFDFRDTMYCYVPEYSRAPSVAEQGIVDFLSLLPYVSLNKTSEVVKKMLDSAEVDVFMYNYFYQRGEHYLYNPNSRIRNDEFFIPFLEHVVSSSKVIESNKVRPKYQLNLAYRNRVGEKALDFTYTLNSGVTGNLYGISGQNILLMFFNPDCKECQETTAEIKNSAVISAAIEAGKLKVVSIYPDENIEIWKNYLAIVPFLWINGYDKTLSIRNKEIYDLKAIPTLYLLDKDKKVIFKDTSVERIQAYLERN